MIKIIESLTESKNKSSFEDFFEKHGIKPIAFWTSVDDEESDYLIYLLQFDDIETQKKAWKMVSCCATR